jgi:hypothetical protein
MSDDPVIPDPLGTPQPPADLDVARRARRMAGARSGAGSSPFQFGLLHMLVLTAVVAVLCALIFAVPDWLSVIAAFCLMVLLPMLLTVGIIYGRGYQRTFSIGGLFPAGALLFLVLQVFMFGRGVPFAFDGDVRPFVWITLLVVCILCIVAGLLAVWLRWALESSGRRARARLLKPELPHSPEWPET